MYSKSKCSENSSLCNKNEDNNDVLYCFEGIMEFRTIDYLLNNAIKELDIYGVSKPIQKKAFRIMLESLENIQKHSGYRQESHSFSKFILKTNQSELIFSTTNCVLNSNKSELQKKIEEINQSDIDKLKQMQEKKLISGELTEKGGSGIGLINIAIRSKNKLDYFFEPIDNETSLFNLQIKINIK